MAASACASVPAVRKFLFSAQVDMAKKYNVIMDGRDIGTTILPNAQVKIFLTASPEVRAARRAGELQGLTREQVLADIEARDAKDTLVVDFMNPAPGVTLVDTSDLDFAQSVQAVIDIVREAQA